uniref:Uncharacterized protein n=1 Tax=Anopheles darlingi TaxID=43151 RepID=A0A2M4D5Y9_ANODA
MVFRSQIYSLLSLATVCFLFYSFVLSAQSYNNSVLTHYLFCFLPLFNIISFLRFRTFSRSLSHRHTYSPFVIVSQFCLAISPVFGSNFMFYYVF